MAKFGKRRVQLVCMADIQGYCGCRCSCSVAHIKENAKNAAPSWVAQSLTEPMS